LRNSSGNFSTPKGNKPGSPGCAVKTKSANGGQQREEGALLIREPLFQIVQAVNPTGKNGLVLGLVVENFVATFLVLRNGK
jgi:hypothetical protein